MKDEIKEILDRLDYNEWEVDLYKVPIQWSELYDIRDYITNLHERIDKAINLLNKEDIVVKLQEFENKYTVNFYDKKVELLNILNGDNNER